MGWHVHLYKIVLLRSSVFTYVRSSIYFNYNQLWNITTSNNWITFEVVQFSRHIDNYGDEDIALFGIQSRDYSVMDGKLLKKTVLGAWVLRVAVWIQWLLWCFIDANIRWLPSKVTKKKRNYNNTKLQYYIIRSFSGCFAAEHGFQLGTLSHVINARACGYRELSDWPTVVPDPSVRNVDVVEPPSHGERKGGRKTEIKKKAFYSESEESSSGV